MVGLRRCSLLLLLAFGVAAFPSPALAKVLRVGVSGHAPFVKRDRSAYSGISVEIWQDVSTALNQPFEWVQQTNTESNLKALAAGEIDLAVGPISITSQRLANPKIDFTQPYFQAEEGLLVPITAPTLLTRLRPFFGLAALSSVAALLMLLFVVGNLIWLAERRSNSEQFPRAYLHGVGNGMWFALVTLTTVGYGDRAPQSRTGRAIAGVWMVLSLVALSSITAGLASAFTVSLAQQSPAAIDDIGDLRDRPVAVVDGTSSEALARFYGARSSVVSSLDDGVDLLRRHQVRAVMFDSVQLRYYLSRHPDLPLKLARVSLAQEAYGFAVPVGSPLRTPIDVQLVEMSLSGRIKAITDQALR